MKRITLLLALLMPLAAWADPNWDFPSPYPCEFNTWAKYREWLKNEAQLERDGYYLSYPNRRPKPFRSNCAADPYFKYGGSPTQGLFVEKTSENPYQRVDGKFVTAWVYLGKSSAPLGEWDLRYEQFVTNCDTKTYRTLRTVFISSNMPGSTGLIILQDDKTPKDYPPVTSGEMVNLFKMFCGEMKRVQ